MNNTEKLMKLILDSSNIVFFGGAGVSTESKIPDFRSDTGLYKAKNNLTYPPEEILSHSFFKKHTEDFFSFYKDKMIYKNARPNDAHYALAKLEKMGKLKAIITQNIDGLHQVAGSKEVIELHGSIHRNYCMKCNKYFDLKYISGYGGIPKCNHCGGTVKPDVVLYEEPLDMESINRAVYFVSKCDLLIVGGTSLVVYPAAGLVDYYTGDNLILINKSATSYDSKASIVIQDSIGKVLKSVVDEMS
ncbi:NAD-dependent protein deacylase [Clostridium rectalis]|uniref:NAD-dependent protein deacylase n=1 Tax=Clostridium rectalis TaxID=2040295 RepID=UPI000F637ED9|nr:NAD-dependent protein deacylase [Clostridium rectalis]